MDMGLKQSLADELNVEVSDLTSDTLLADLANWDSVVALSVMVMLGDFIGSPVSPDDMRKLNSFGDIEILVADRLAGG